MAQSLTLSTPVFRDNIQSQFNSVSHSQYPSIQRQYSVSVSHRLSLSVPQYSETVFSFSFTPSLTLSTPVFRDSIQFQFHSVSHSQYPSIQRQYSVSVSLRLSLSVPQYSETVFSFSLTPSLTLSTPIFRDSIQFQFHSVSHSQYPSIQRQYSVSVSHRLSLSVPQYSETVFSFSFTPSLTLSTPVFRDSIQFQFNSVSHSQYPSIQRQYSVSV